MFFPLLHKTKFLHFTTEWFKRGILNIEANLAWRFTFILKASFDINIELVGFILLMKLNETIFFFFWLKILPPTAISQTTQALLKLHL